MSAGVTLAELLKRASAVPATHKPASRPHRPVYSMPASAFDPQPERETETEPARVGAIPVADDGEEEPASTEAEPAVIPADTEVPVAPRLPRSDRPGALSERQLYQLWLRLTLQPDAPVIMEWRQMYLEARELGLTRLGNGNYRPDQWRKAVQRLVREGLAPAFYWRTRGRPPRTLTTRQHLAAWAIAGFARLLGRRRRTWRDDMGPRTAPSPVPSARHAEEAAAAPRAVAASPGACELETGQCARYNESVAARRERAELQARLPKWGSREWTAFRRGFESGKSFGRKDAEASAASRPRVDRTIRIAEVMHITGLGRTTIWKLERAGDFPKRVPRLSGSRSRAVGWSLREVVAWHDGRKAARRA